MAGGHHDSKLPRGCRTRCRSSSAISPALGDDSGRAIRRNLETCRVSCGLTTRGSTRTSGCKCGVGSLEYGHASPGLDPSPLALAIASSLRRKNRRACACLIEPMEEQCARWFYGKFPGRFSRAAKDRRRGHVSLGTRCVPGSGVHHCSLSASTSRCSLEIDSGLRIRLVVQREGLGTPEGAARCHDLRGPA